VFGEGFLIIDIEHGSYLLHGHHDTGAGKVTALEESNDFLFVFCRYPVDLYNLVAL